MTFAHPGHQTIASSLAEKHLDFRSGPLLVVETQCRAAFALERPQRLGADRRIHVQAFSADTFTWRQGDALDIGRAPQVRDLQRGLEVVDLEGDAVHADLVRQRRGRGRSRRR